GQGRRGAEQADAEQGDKQGANGHEYLGFWTKARKLAAGCRGSRGFAPTVKVRGFRRTWASEGHARGGGNGLCCRGFAPSVTADEVNGTCGGVRRRVAAA